MNTVNSKAIAVILDGGDHGDRPPIKAMKHLVENGKINPEDLIAFGSPQAIKRLKAAFPQARRYEPGRENSGVTYVECGSNFITMKDSFREIRSKKDSSMYLAMSSLKNKECGAVVSSANTTGLVVLASKHLERLFGIDGKMPPALAINPPNTKVPCIMLDVGATKVIEKASSLVGLAKMGAIYAKEVLGVPKPVVKLIDMGEEPEKGDDTSRLAHELLSKIEWIEFGGNIEAKKILVERVNVVVCEGKIGNNTIKSWEGVALWLAEMLGPLWTVAAFLRRTFTPGKKIRSAFMLGYNGVIVKAHGDSNWKGLAQAILLARRELGNRVIEKIQEELLSEMRRAGINPEEAEESAT